MERELLDSLTVGDRQDLLVKLVAMQAELHAELLSVIRSLQAEKVWRDDGARDMGEWLAGVLPVAGRTARRWARLATRLGGLPALRAALGDGTLSVDQAEALAAFVAVDDEAVWVREAAALTVEQLEAAARRRRRADDERGEEPEESELHTRQDPHTGNVKFWGCARGADAAQFLASVRATATADCAATAAPGAASTEPEPVEGARTGGGGLAERRAWASRCGEALMRLVRGAGAHRPQITVHVDIGTLFGSTGGGRAWLEPGTVPASRRNVDEVLGLGGAVRFLYETSRGEPVAFTRARTPHPVLADAIRGRDVHCQIGGCRNSFCEIHHVVWYSDGGATEWANLVLVCWHHHHQIHQGALRISGSPGHWLVTLPEGHEVGKPPP